MDAGERGTQPVMAVFVCTRESRLVRLEPRLGAWTSEVVLDDVEPQCVAADSDRVLVGTRGDGLRVSGDSGASWEAPDMPESDVFSVAIGPADGALYAGSEPSRLFVSRDGENWTEREALQEIPSRESWSFPPRPWTHHVRWIAPDPQEAERLLVGIELGGLMYTEDGGASFSDHRPGAKRDTHNIAWHPSAAGRAYEAAGDGAAWSRDGGRTWSAADEGRDLPYCWALAVDPADPERWYVSAADGPFTAHSGPDATGRLYRWQEGWRPLSLPSDSMPYALLAADGQLLAGLASGHLLRSADTGESWEDTGVELGSLLAMAGDGLAG
jgi:photosystem II stability/assembly factor-like uncharacterized protein